MAKCLLNQKELQEALNNISKFESEAFSPSESPSNDSDEMSTDEEEEALVEVDATPAITSVLWKEPHNTFESRLTAPDERKEVVTVDANRSAREIDIFLKLFRTNERIRLIENHKNERLNMN
ncbi:hypothetical protein QE152_g2010 [Popillia japonica]|uniref:Uncharacterized protein n=1 Tax=Popillia japonica TaxID=7064 RepID=A0AAW1N2F9_POPJA